MSHMVIYRGTDGKPGYHQTDDIHDAVTFVEQLRNDNGVEHARIFRLEEVAFEYRPYFRVELRAGEPGLGSGSSAPAAVAAAPAAAVEAAPAVKDEPVAAEKAKVATDAAAEKAEAATDAASSSASSAADTAASKAEDAASSATETVKTEAASAAEGDSSVGARRGLFGR